MLENLVPPGRFRSCKVSEISANLSPEDKRILEDAIASPEWPIKALSRALGERGLQVSETPLGNHRAKTCACFKG
jgi:hypothetical protein